MTAQAILLQRYGPPGQTYIDKYCIVWQVRQDFPWYPVKDFLVNKDFKDILFKALTALQAADLHTELKTDDGCYDDRAVRGYTTESIHGWAAAIDWNAAENPMVVKPTAQQRKGKWSDAFIATCKAAGLFYGGDFILRADPMHFAMVDG